jgi:hypothetical protein
MKKLIIENNTKGEWYRLFLAVLLLGFIALIFLKAYSAFASFDFDPVSSQPTGTTVTVTCDSENNLFVYDSTTGNETDFHTSCMTTPAEITDLNGAGIYTAVECDPSVLLSVCYDNVATLTEIQADSGYVTEENYEWTGSDVAPAAFFSSSCTVDGSTTTCDYTGMLFYMLAVFFFLWYFQFIYAFFTHLANKFL